MSKKELIFQTTENVWTYIAAFLRWSFLGILVGILGGMLGVLFSKSVAFATEIRMGNPWLLYLLPLGGLAIVGLYKLCGVSGVGTNEVFEGVRTEKGVSVLLAPAIFLGTVITHLLGGSAGREGAALQLGGSVASFIGDAFHLKGKRRHILTMCGMSALFSAVFGTPMATCIFAVEVVSVGQIFTTALYPCMMAAVSAFGVAEFLGLPPERFRVEFVPQFGMTPLWRVVVVAICCAVVSMLFCWTMHAISHIFKKWFKNEYIRVAVGGLAIIALTFVVGTTDYNGGGIHIIERIFEENSARPEAFLLKIIFTAITIGAGFKGGEIIPTLFIGATLGGTISLMIGLSPAFGAAVGVAALFCGVTNCPLATVFLCMELFGSEGAIFYMVASFISFLLSGYYSLYSGQKIIFSKVH